MLLGCAYSFFCATSSHAYCYLEQVGLSCPPGSAYVLQWESWGLEGSLSRGAARDSNALVQGKKWVPGAELIFARAPGKFLRLEAGLAYRPVQFQVESNSVTIKRFVVPLSLGIEIKKTLALMGGAFVGAGVGTVEIETPAGVSKRSFDELALNRLDYGYSASALLKVPLSQRLHLSFRANFIQSVGSVAQESDLFIRNVTALLGLRWEAR